ncbi:MAG: Flp pilus assembly protein CpaB [Betaproteobacteria bacterium]|nr:Flp pilus assembly protein CpaB [Betaproteobacteria bacterium]
MTTVQSRPARSVLRLVSLGAAALGFAGLSVVLADRHVSETIARQQAAAKVAPPATVPVVVAKFDLIAGEAVSADNMAVRPIPVDLAPGSALRPEQFDAKSGMRLARGLRSGEPLLAEILQPAETGGLSARVRQGIRALTISVDDVNAVSGMLRPGDRIDLLFSARAQGADAGAAVETARVLVQNVAVLATGRQLKPGADEGGARPFTSITVELSPEDATRLVVAQRTGRITALLRNPDDRFAVSNAPVDAHALMGTAPRAAAATPRSVASVGPEIIIGGTGGLSAGRLRAQDEPAPAASRDARPPAAPVSPLTRVPTAAPTAAQTAAPNSAAASMQPPMSPVPGPLLTQPLLIR